MPVAVMGFFFGGFCHFLLVLSAQALVSAQNPPKITLYGNCHSLAPMIAAQVGKVHGYLFFCIQCTC